MVLSTYIRENKEHKSMISGLILRNEEVEENKTDLSTVYAMKYK